MADPTLLQLNLRRNAQELEEAVASLNNWEDEIKQRDELLRKQKPILKKKLPPVRGRVGGHSSGKKNQDAKRKGQIKSNDYDAWNKFDVDAACEAVDNTSSNEEELEEQSEEEEGKRKELAALEKERGNQLFKEGKYEAAVERYTQAIQLDHTSPVPLANRAMALLKLSRHGAAEEDCTVCIALDESYAKAWMRRAMARTKLGKTREAIEDYKKLLLFEPGNKFAQSEIERLQKVYKAKSKVVDGKYVFAVKRPERLRSKKPLVRVAIDEVRLPVIVSVDETTEKKQEHVPLNDTIPDKSLAIPNPPTTSIEFQSQWRALSKNKEALRSYFMKIPVADYPHVLKQSLETDTFSDILQMLYQKTESGESCLQELEMLSKVQRFSVAVMFLSKHDKSVLKEIFKRLLQLHSKDSLVTILKAYSLNLSSI